MTTSTFSFRHITPASNEDMEYIPPETWDTINTIVKSWADHEAMGPEQ
jgi:hypothetical protein